MQVLTYDYFVWTLAYFLGLQFTHADQGIMQQFTLDWNVMKHWPLILWVIFFGLILILGTLLKVVLTFYVGIGILKYYVIVLVAFFTWFLLKARHYKDVHIHHYCIGMFMVSTLCHQDAFITFAVGIFNGIMIEGSSRWGLDPVFSNDPSESAAAALKSLKQSQIRKENYLLKTLAKKFESRESRRMK